MCEALTNRDLIFAVATICFALIEYYLGKTDRIKSSSILELLLNFLSIILKIKKEK